jgi:hypothetical protein
MNAIGGRLLPISGAMSRGGMMLRGIGGAFRRWTLTNPSERNAFLQDWPSHGFITAMMSPNVMTLSFWDHYAGIMYEVTTTWNWMKEKAKTANIDFPPPEVVQQAFKDEMALEKGPGGGTAFLAGGGQQTPPPTTAPTAAGPTTTPAPTAPTTAAPPATPVPSMTIAAELQKLTMPPAAVANSTCKYPPSSFTHYAFMANCHGCDTSTVVAGVPFSLFISGYTMSPSCTQLFLSMSPLGCNFPNDAKLSFMVAGTERVSAPSSNVFHFTTAAGQPATSVYVCLSSDSGHTFTPLTRADSALRSFVVKAAPEGPIGEPSTPQPQAQAPPPPAPGTPQTPPVPQSLGTTTPPPQSALSPSTGGSSSGLSLGAVVIVGVACLVVGSLLSMAVKRTNWHRFERAANGGPSGAGDDDEREDLK